jgi:hypothetical protein
MSRRFSLLLFCGIVVSFASVTQAAGKLPKDGAWARYYVLFKSADGTERTARTTIRFTGTVVEKGERHRYVEWTDAQKQIGEDGKKTTKTSVRKFLVTEKSLRESRHPLREFVRGWSGEEGQPPVIETVRGNRELADAIDGRYLLFLPGVMSAASSTPKPRTIDYQMGQLRIKTGRTGTRETRYQPRPGLVFTWKTDYQVWRHKDVPLGMASAKTATVIIIKQANGKPMVRDFGRIEWWVEAWGTDAKSAFPDAK